MLGVALALTAADSAAAQRQDRSTAAAPAPRIMVVDSQRILREADAVKLLQSGIEAERDAFREQIRQHETELREADAVLNRERPTISNEEYLKRRHALEQRYAGYQSDVADRRRALEGRFSKGMHIVESKLMEIVGELAKERNVNLVLPKSAVLLADSDYDATDEVMKRLNAALPRVVLPEE
ncbi:OmpH family outer membrane protein [Tistlia consotensis]|uniref:OmpH family outer membrane protein n=1 Tax=Tistlia consotensis TaxID=1321365 RepID=UPI0013566813|nr:OmpH family outer membrane protein [Tistlia consotensis]